MRKSHGFRSFHVTEIALYHAPGKLPETDVAHRFFDEAIFSAMEQPETPRPERAFEL
jgi:hypothetical protein